MYRPKVYLCGAIDRIPIKEALEWRANATTILWDMGFVALCPLSSLNPEEIPDLTMQEINHLDMFMVVKSDILLVNLTHHVVYDGSIHEIEKARSLDKPVIAFGDALQGFSSFYITKRLDTLESALNYIDIKFSWLKEVD